jgi:hypothetical protein
MEAENKYAVTVSTVVVKSDRFRVSDGRIIRTIAAIGRIDGVGISVSQTFVPDL